MKKIGFRNYRVLFRIDIEYTAEFDENETKIQCIEKGMLSESRE